MKISGIQLCAKDVVRLGQFYRDAFGLKVVREEPGFISLSSGAVLLSIHQNRRSARERGGEMTSLCFSVEDMSSAKDALKAHGLKLGKIHAVDGFEFAKGRDPEGNQIHVSSWEYRNKKR